MTKQPAQQLLTYMWPWPAVHRHGRRQY